MPQTDRKKILIVDDEQDLVEPLALRLRADPRFEVKTAFDGEQGLRAARADPPDVALIDIAMPGLDGWQVLKRLRQGPETSGVKVVLMTAWLTKDLGRRAESEGVERLLLKPFEEKDLMDALETAAAVKAGAQGGGTP